MKNLKGKNKNGIEPWQIAAARFCVENSEKGFSIEELKNFIKTNYEVNDTHIQHFYAEEIQMPTGRQYAREADRKNRWIPPLDLVAKVTDYDELKEARKNARQAFGLAIIAILISIISTCVNVYYSSRDDKKDIMLENSTIKITDGANLDTKKY